MFIDNQMIDDGPSDYYDDTFRNVLEDYMSVLRNDTNSTIMLIDASKAYKYEFDFYSLLSSYSVPVQYHWLIMRLNKMVVPTEASRELRSLIIPDFQTVERIRQSHKTVRKIK